MLLNVSVALCGCLRVSDVASVINQYGFQGTVEFRAPVSESRGFAFWFGVTECHCPGIYLDRPTDNLLAA